MNDADDLETDEILGRTRCARCGERLNGDIECPFCSAFPERTSVQQTPKWIYLTACLLTSPLSLPFLYGTNRLKPGEKWVAASGMIIWAIVYWAM